MIGTRKSHGKAWGRWPLAGKRLIKRTQFLPSQSKHFKDWSQEHYRNKISLKSDNNLRLPKEPCWLIVKCDTPSEHVV